MNEWQPSPALTAVLEAIQQGRLQEAQRTAAALSEDVDRRVGQTVVAARLKDCDGLRRLAADAAAADLRRHPLLHALFARERYWTCGLPDAAADLQAADERSHPAHPDVFGNIHALSRLSALIEREPIHVRANGNDPDALLTAGAGLLLVDAQVDGGPAAPFIVDTGAPTSLLSQRSCRRAGLRYLDDAPYISRDSAGTAVRLFPFLMDRIDVGRTTIRRWTGYVFDFPPSLDVTGLISPLDLFRDTAVEIDLRGSRLHTPDHAAAADWATAAGEPVHRADLVWDEGNPLLWGRLTAAVGGWFLLDTGAASNVLSRGWAERIGTAHAPDAASRSHTAGGTIARGGGLTCTLQVGTAGSDDVEFVVADLETRAMPPAAAHIVPAGLIGLPWMAGRRLLISRNRRELWFTDPRST